VNVEFIKLICTPTTTDKQTVSPLMKQEAHQEMR